MSTSSQAPDAALASALPEPFGDWFDKRGWAPRPHQLALLEQAERSRDTLLVAPTGAGKTLAGFLPSLVALARSGGARNGAAPRGSGLTALYVSPLKALAVDVERNLMQPVREMDLAITVEARTGDTSVAKRARQKLRPPDILLTTPEQVGLLTADETASWLFADLRFVILDELHALAPSKRGDLLALGLARLRGLAPGLVATGLSATVARPTELRAWLRAQRSADTQIELADIVEAKGGAQPDITLLETEGELPWASHTTRYAVPDILAAIARHRLALVFVNTRLQAELMFQELWRLNEANLPIAIHHGSLDAGQRRKVEAAMAAGRLRAVVCTSTLDLGIDWGDVDLVINVGAPKGASRLLQRIGRANHCLDEPSKALLVPSNRFEVLECRAALDAAYAGTQDAVLDRRGTLDVLAQHVLGTACSAPFAPDALYAEVRTAQPYAHLKRADFDRVVDLVATGGYALRAYDRFARLKPTDDGRLRIAHPWVRQRYRLNAGTIVESPMLKVRLIGKGRIGAAKRAASRTGRTTGSRSFGHASETAALRGGRILGEIDEYFAGELKVGDAFAFGGEVVRFEGYRETEVFVTRASSNDPIVPSYPGGRFPLSTHLASRVRAMLADPDAWPALPPAVAFWLDLQRLRSLIPAADEVLIETFPYGGEGNERHHMVLYPFEGRLAHQTLGMLLTRRLERIGAKPLGFVASDYALAVWGLADLSYSIANGGLDLARLLEEDMLGDDLDAWLAETSLMRRTFRHCAIISGLVERRHPGKEKSGRQLTVSSDLIFDVLRRHDPRHVLLEAAFADAATGLLDIARLSGFLKRIKGRIRHVALERPSPLSVPVLVEMGRETIHGEARDAMLRAATDRLIRAAME